ncbi:MAG: hypothetical protein QOG09_223 [Solirubrobacterales bacterium]|nr:hypothetical protein [Solirubrobacterales bacterium]MDX6662121.1 hypothetical protein [Solirubrobacterales bacterium]
MSAVAKRLGALTAIAAAGLLAGCGGGGGGGEQSVAQSQDATSSQPRATAIKIASGGKFNPAAIYAKTSPGVVTIRSVFGGSGGIFGSGGGIGQGSGFVISDSGEIVTNAHVVTDGGQGGGSGGKLTQAKEVSVEFPDRNRVSAKVVGYDPFADVALIKVAPDGLDLQPLTLASGQGLIVGAPVAAIGSPFGEEGSLSVGVISATDRSIQSLTKFQIDSGIQTDASINPGNSGGPLLDADGQVIGINQQIESSSGSNSGVGFAVPVTAVRRSLDQLRASGKVSYAYIGVTSRALYPQLADHLKLESKTGALVADIVKGGPADKAGVQAGSREERFQGERVKVGGDVIIAVDGHKLIGDNDLSRAIAIHKPGDTVTLELLHAGAVKQVRVRLGNRPLSATP